MNDQHILEYLHGQPFKPFDIRMSDGRVYTVDHPDFLMRSRDGKVIYYVTDDNRLVTLAISQITSLEVANTRAA